MQYKSHSERILELQIGDKVKTSYRSDKEMMEAINCHLQTGSPVQTAPVIEVTIEDIIPGSSCETGIKVKLKEIPEPLDSSWIKLYL
jgi:hypothetical protein